MQRVFDNWIKAYMKHTRFLESPDGFHFWTAVSTIAGVLRRKVWIPMIDFTWTPNFYIVLVGPPGIAAKSTSMRVGMSLLRKVDGVHIGPSSATWHGMGEVLRNAQESITIEGKKEPVIQSCVTLAISELGTFLRTDDGEMIDNLTDWWDAQDPIWYRKTKTAGDTVIYNPWINLIACTTPAWLKANFPDVMVGGGLTSRMIFVYGAKKRQLVAYPTELTKESEHEHEASLLLNDLKQIANISGPYTLTRDAIAFGTEWYQNHWNGVRKTHIIGDRFGGYVARKQTHIHKLAIVIAAAQRNDRIITHEDLQTAVELISNTERDLQTVFNSIGVSESARPGTEVLSLIQAHKDIKYQELWQLCFNRMPNKDFIAAIVGILEAGHAKVVVRDGVKHIVSCKTDD